MALIKQKETEQAQFKRNPVIDEQLNEFIRDNEKLVSYTKALPREELERKYLLTKMNAEKQQQGYDQKVLEFINKPENSKLKRSISATIPKYVTDESKKTKKLLYLTKNTIRNEGIKIS